MKRILRTTIIALVVVCIADKALAQFTINSSTQNSEGTRPLRDQIKSQSEITNNYFSKARHDAERRRVILERNFFKFVPTITINQAQYENWTKGGSNTFSATASVYLNHKYSRNKFYIDYTLDGRYGMNIIDKKSFKFEDQFKLTIPIGYNINKHWSYSMTTSLNSQFTRGYKSRSDKTLISGFMAPGTIGLSLGLTFRDHPKDENIRLSFNPIGGQMTTVLIKELYEKGTHGLQAGKKSKNTFGSSLDLNISYKIWKERIFYRTRLFAYSNYSKSTNGSLEQWLDFKLGRFTTLRTYFNLVYDNLVKTPDNRFFQLQYSYGLGVAYTFQNKQNKH